MKRFIIEQSDKEFYTSHSGLALIGLGINRYSALPAAARKAFPVTKGTNGIGLDDILRSYVGMLSLGWQTDYEAVTNKRDDDYFKQSLGIKKVPSTETLRQRFDELAEKFLPLADASSTDFLKSSKPLLTQLDTGHVPLDCDVFPMDNSQTKKEGVSRTYKGADGYAPIAAYLGREGWCLELELREGKQHSQCDFIPFLDRVMDKARALTSRKILVRLDSAHDALETRANVAGRKKVSYILKWNPRKEEQGQWAKRIFAEGKVTTPRLGKKVGLLRVHLQQEYEGKTYQFMRVMRAVERSIDKRGQFLRFIGQLALTGDKSPVRHPAKRRRIRTVMQELMYLAARLVKTGHRLKIVFSRYCPGFEAFKLVYGRLAWQ